MKPKVYTYLDRPDDVTQAGMVELWRRSWDARGWEPVLLDEGTARRHPLFDLFDATVRSYPTVNPPNYEAACFVRWLALDWVGGGLLTDYDVLNHSFPAPATFPDAPVVALDDERIPCAVFTQPSAQLYRLFLDRRRMLQATVLEGGRPHVSDMHAFKRYFKGPVVPLCSLYQGPENTKTPLWHVASAVAKCTGAEKLTYLEHVFRWIV